VPPKMPADTVQMQMIRRYARILREEQALHRGPRIGARELRSKAQAAADAAGSVARSAIEAVRPPQKPTT
jgi:hypothetical protein